MKLPVICTRSQSFSINTVEVMVTKRFFYKFYNSFITGCKTYRLKSQFIFHTKSLNCLVLCSIFKPFCSSRSFYTTNWCIAVISYTKSFRCIAVISYTKSFRTRKFSSVQKLYSSLSAAWEFFAFGKKQQEKLYSFAPEFQLRVENKPMQKSRNFFT